MRILCVFDEYWRASLVPPLVGFAGGETIAWLAKIDWGVLIATSGLAITTIGGAGIGLYRQWRLTSIEIREREKRLRHLPIDRLDPDATSAARRDSSKEKGT